MAAQLREETGAEVVVEKGGLGELSVWADGEKLVEESRLTYTLPSTVVKKTKKALET